MAAPALVAAVAPLLGAPGDWVEVLLPILFAIFWLISQLVAIVQRVRGAGKVERAPRPPVAAPGPPRPRVAAAPRDQLQMEIEAFRRAQAEAAATTRDRAQPSAPPARPKPARPVIGPSAAGPRAERPAASRVAAAPKARAEAPVPLPLTAAGGITRHVEEAFAHDLAHSAGGIHPALGGAGAGGGAGAETAARPSVSTAGELLAMLRNPATVRQAILLREVLDRPLHRW